MAVRDPWRDLLGRGVAWVAGLSPEEGAQAVAVAEDVRARVAEGAEVVRRLRRGRAPRAVERPARAAARELPRGEVVDAVVVEDGPSESAMVAEVVQGDPVPSPPVRRSRYA